MPACSRLICAFTLSAAALAQAAGAPEIRPVIPEDVSRTVIEQLRQRASVDPLVERLRVAIEQTDALLERLEQQPAAFGRQSESRMLLEGQSRSLALLKDETGRQLREQAQLDGSHVSSRPWDEAAARVTARFDRILNALDAIEKAKPQDVQRALAAARRAIFEVHGRYALAQLAPAVPLQPQMRLKEMQPSLPELRATQLPAYVASLKERAAMTLAANGTFGAVLDPVPAEAASCAYTAADLAGTPDLSLTQEIRDLARQLEYDPRKVYQWVYENIRFEPYWGSLKGAQGALWSKA